MDFAHLMLVIFTSQIFKVDSTIIINDRQNTDCLVSNFCERTLSLECKDRNDISNPLKLSGPKAWDAVCGGLEGTAGKKVDIEITGNGGKAFEVREICLNVTNGDRVDWKYGTIEDTDDLETGEFCIKPADKKHMSVESFTITVEPLAGAKVRVSLKVIACGDKTDLGTKSTIPDANTTRATVENPAKGHEECFDQYTLNYGNREAGIILLKDKLSGSKENNALHGSQKIYSGAVRQNVNFEFTVQLLNRKPKFVWWRVCFLIRYVSKMTFTMYGETDTWIQKFEVCDPDSYFWKCYNPWYRFDEITKGEILLEPGDSNKAITVQEMSIAICLDNEFAGDIVRIGRAFIRCPPEKANVTDICDAVRIRASDLNNFTSPFDLSDEKHKRNTTAAWRILGGKNRPMVVARGTTEVFYIYTLRTQCPLLSDGRFQARSIQFWGQHIEKVLVKFCDINHPLKHKQLYCDADEEGFTKWNDPSTGVVIHHKAKDPSVPQKFIINNWFVVTGVRVLFMAAKPYTNPMRIWNFNIYACCDPLHTQRDLSPPPPARDMTQERVTGDTCAEPYQLVHQSKMQKLGFDMFDFTDRDEERDETMALQGSDQEYIGEPGRNVYFHIAFQDGDNFELWKVCGHYLNIQRVTYVMETSRVTFIQSKIFCGFNVWQRTCYYPRNEGIIVRKAAIKVEVVPGREAHIKGIEVEACRDHFNFVYTHHVHPCDFKSLVIDTPRNQTISIHALKDRKGNWLQTHLYHFTDHTGNDGDNTWFTLEPQHHLVSAIWTTQTYITLKWDVVNNRVVFEIYITAGNQVHTTITVVNLKELEQFTVDKFKTETPTVRQSSLKHCNLMPFSFKQCNKEVRSLILTADIKARGKFTVPGYFTQRTGRHQFILPKRKFGPVKKQKNKQLCSSVTEVMEAECERHSVFNRIQHQFICDSMKNVLTKYDTVRRFEVSRVYQACQLTYKTLRWTCAVLADRPRSALNFFFTEACLTKTNYVVDELDEKLGSPTTTIQIRVSDQHNQALNAPKITVKDLNTIIPVNVNSSKFVITGITTRPKQIPEVHSYNYTVCINYECANGGKDEELLVMPRVAPDATTEVTVCKRLTKRRCCVVMHRRLRKGILHSVMMVYFPDGKTNTLQQEEIIPTF